MVMPELLKIMWNKNVYKKGMLKEGQIMWQRKKLNLGEICSLTIYMMCFMAFIGSLWTNKTNLNIWKSEVDHQQKTLIYQDNCSPYTMFPWDLHAYQDLTYFLLPYVSFKDFWDLPSVKCLTKSHGVQGKSNIISGELEYCYN